MLAHDPAHPAEPQEREPTHRPLLAGLLVIAIATGLGAALIGLPTETGALPGIARQAMRLALPRWHTTEPVNEIVYGTRGFDTFGETFLLLAAVVSVVSLARRPEPRRGFIGEAEAGHREQGEIDPREVATDERERQARVAELLEMPDDDGGRPETPDDEELGSTQPVRAEAMTVVVRTAARVAAVPLAVASVYLVAWGFAPGGGFPAGAVVLGVVLLVYAGFGYRRILTVIRPDRIEVVELLGAMAIVIIGLLGLLVRGSFSANFLPLGPVQTIRSGGVIQAFSFGELIEVGTGLTLAVFALLGMRHDWSPDLEEIGRAEGSEDEDGAVVRSPNEE
jgi:multicomponent Na+:H+ antiporter subunit B